MSRDKGQPSRFQNKFYSTLNLHSNQRMQDETSYAHGTIKTHSGNLTLIVNAVQRKECTDASTKTRKVEFGCLALASFTHDPMQNKMKNNVNPYRSLQVMHVRLPRFNSSLVK